MASFRNGPLDGQVIELAKVTSGIYFSRLEDNSLVIKEEGTKVKLDNCVVYKKAGLNQIKKIVFYEWSV